MIKKQNVVISGSKDKSILYDLFMPNEEDKHPVVIFCHGYKGYKDWGAWNLVAEDFVNKGFSFLKFNFSHNGGTIENPIDFPDLEAFSKNNYSIELADLNLIIDEAVKMNKFSSIHLIGHSRGGGIATLGAKHNNVKSLTTWAAVSDFGSRFLKGEALEKWKENGVFYVKNGRTKQEMPHLYQFFEDFKENEIELNIRKAVSELNKPMCIIHGSNDEAVLFDEAINLKSWKEDAKLFQIENSNHTFGSKHPWEEDLLPQDLKEVVDITIKFLKNE